MTETIFKVGHTRIKLQGVDLDGDGKSTTEVVSRISDIIRPDQKSETAESIENINKDVIDASRLSTMDFLSRINPHEYDAMTKIDVLIAYQFLPISASWINRTKMRKSVSLKGLGREEIVKIVQGMEEKQVKKSGFIDRLMGKKEG